MKVRQIKVTQRNQITIPYDIRSDLKWIKPGAPIEIAVSDKNTLVLRPGKAKPEPKKKETKSRRKKTSLLRKVALKDEYNSVI